MTHRIHESELPALLTEAVGRTTPGLDHARLQTRGRRRRRVRQATAATGSLGVAAALAAAVPLLLPPGGTPLLGGEPSPIGETVAPDEAPTGRNIGESCPGDLGTSWTCLEPDQRPPAPEPALEPLGGEPSPIAALRGQNVVVSVWGSWCGPCARQQSELNRVHATRDDFTIVGIATLDTERRVAEFVDTHDIDYPMLLDPEGDHAELLAEALQAVRPDATRHGVPPATYLVDRDGRIAAWHFGEYDRNELVAAIDGVLR